MTDVHTYENKGIISLKICEEFPVTVDKYSGVPRTDNANNSGFSYVQVHYQYTNCSYYEYCNRLSTKELYYNRMKVAPSVGTAVAQSRCCATNRKVAGSIPASVSGFFIDIKSFRSQYGPVVDSASNRNEYQEYFLGVKAAGT